jgi:hypothetical protein
MTCLSSFSNFRYPGGFDPHVKSVTRRSMGGAKEE